MLRKILQNPFRLFILVALVSILGLWCCYKLPISLYPQTSKPVVQLGLSYGGFSSQEFIRKYGANIEYQLENIKNTGLKIDFVKADYGTTGVTYLVTYDWETPFDKALKEVEGVASSVRGILPKESSDSVQVWQWNENGGFLAISFYSQKHSLTELYNILDPLLVPGLKKIPDSKGAVLWNPEAQEVSVQLIPEKLSSYGLLPGDVFRSLETALTSMTGGEIKMGMKSANVQIQSSLKGGAELENHQVNLQDGRIIHLKDVAKIYTGRSEQQSKMFKTNGKESLILFADPKSGANVKRMAEDILELVESNKAVFPEGIEYRVLVDPSEFISNSIKNLFKDVALAAFLAVLVLYLFVGNLKNVATSAIEIPLSMVIAFIVMYLTDMNLNLISLGGLAIAAGMNVDASIVVLENIFRHQEESLRAGVTKLDPGARLELIYRAVKEVSAPVFLSIATTLIVFIPLTMTTNLTNAILGDLAKAVIYSHAVSGFVAIFLIPSIRLFLMKESSVRNKPAPIEKQLRTLETNYLRVLERLIGSKTIKLLAYVVPVILAGIMIITIVPRLPKEIVGTPDTDWVFLSISAPGSVSNRQMENILQEIETRALNAERTGIAYTFVQMQGKTQGSVMLRLRNKSEMAVIVKKMQTLFTNTPELYFYVDSWNPAELPLPRMHHLDLKITGKDPEEIRKTASRVKYFVEEEGSYKRINTTPSGLNEKIHQFTPYENVWSALRSSGGTLNLMDVIDITFYAGEGKKPGSLMLKGEMIPINLRFEDERFKDPELLAAYPLKINNHLVPLSALGSFKTVVAPTQIFRRDGREQAQITSTLDKGEDKNWEALADRYRALIDKNRLELTDGKEVLIEMLPAQQELIESLDELKISLLISLLLICLVLWLQFQSMRQVVIIMMTIPLGIIGALPGLFLLNSTLSLNSALGVLLLNGIAVNNAILIVEVMNSLKKKGLSSRAAVIEACRSRLRPILITSLTTGLGMLPIALGLGDGGKILQPLGITVVCGLLFSTAMALVVIPVALYKSEPSLDFETPHDPQEILNLIHVAHSPVSIDGEPVQ